MTIVPIGGLSLQVPQNGSRDFVLEIIEQMRAQMVKLASRILEESSGNRARSVLRASEACAAQAVKA